MLQKTFSKFSSVQDLKDYMKKAGEVTYTTVNRNKSGEGYVKGKYEHISKMHFQTC